MSEPGEGRSWTSVVDAYQGGLDDKVLSVLRGIETCPSRAAVRDVPSVEDMRAVILEARAALVLKHMGPLIHAVEGTEAELARLKTQLTAMVATKTERSSGEIVNILDKLAALSGGNDTVRK